MLAAHMWYVVSEQNRFMTGQVIFCDGGTDALTRGARPQQVYLRYRTRDIVSMTREARHLAHVAEHQEE